MTAFSSRFPKLMDLFCSTVLQYDLDVEPGEAEPRPMFVHSCVQILLIDLARANFDLQKLAETHLRCWKGPYIHTPRT